MGGCSWASVVPVRAALVRGPRCVTSFAGEGSASGRSSPSRVNLRRSVTTKGLFLFGHSYTLSENIRCRAASVGCGGVEGRGDGMARTAGIYEAEIAVESFAADIARAS